MDALLISFLLCALIETHGRLPSHYLTLRKRYGSRLSVPIAMVFAATANTALGAVAGALLARTITPEARNLFFALSLFAAGLALLFARRSAHDLAGWKLGPFFTTAIGLFLLGFGQSPQFLVAGISASFADPWMAGMGGWLGSVAACQLASYVPGEEIKIRPIHLFRLAGGGALMLLGFLLAMSALRLL